jgi:predicted nucleotidyltransferase
MNATIKSVHAGRSSVAGENATSIFGFGQTGAGGGDVAAVGRVADTVGTGAPRRHPESANAKRAVYFRVMFNWSDVYKGNLEWLPERTIYITRHGSHAYGTNTPTSDLDLRGIVIAPKPYYHGFMQKFEGCVQKPPQPDFATFEIRKFFNLAADCNPNVLELLYTDPSDHLLVTPVMERLFAFRDMFLSRKAKHTFSGYAMSQLKRIQGHYRWLKDPPKAPPKREDFGLPNETLIPADQRAAAEASIRDKVNSWELDWLEPFDPDERIFIQEQFARRLTEITMWSDDEADEKVWLSAARSIGLDDNFILLMQRERQYTGKQREWEQFQKWKKERNEDRAILEAKFGYDTKHATHLVRLMRMCREILIEGKVYVRRPDAEELLAVRAGRWTYEELLIWAKRQDELLTEAMKVSILPKEPNRASLDAICIQLVEMML